MLARARNRASMLPVPRRKCVEQPALLERQRTFWNWRWPACGRFARTGSSLRKRRETPA